MCDDVRTPDPTGRIRADDLLRVPVISAALRPGGYALQCPSDGLVAGEVGDFAEFAYKSPIGQPTPAKSLRAWFVYASIGGPLNDLRYERRAFADPSADAVFVGLRDDGSVAANISVSRHESGRWMAGGSSQHCAGGTWPQP